MNVSREGLLLVLDAPVEPYTLLSMQILLKKGSLPIPVMEECRWVQDEQKRQIYHIGVAFVAGQTPVHRRWADAIYRPSIS